MDTPLWTPSPARVASARVTRFIDMVRATGEPSLPVAGTPGAFSALHDWSIAAPAAFWSAVWETVDIIGDRDPDAPVLVGGERMAPPDPVLGPAWFPGVRLNFAENLLRRDDDRPALIAWTETGRRTVRSARALRDEVAAVAHALRAAGVGIGDRVAGYLPNSPEAVIGLLATASIGAVWSSCSPDFGVDGAIDRFGQIAPRVLISIDGYRYNGKAIDIRERVAAIAARLPSLERTVVVPYRDAGAGAGAGADAIAGVPGAVSWADFTAPGRGTAMRFERLPFDQPLAILYSSGTTGLPKCIVHGAGGTLLQLAKEHALHTDIGSADTVFYFTTTGWMMWNWLVNALALEATVVLYDGAPLPAARPAILWDLAAAEGVTVFGTSAKYLTLSEKQGLAPARTHDLSRLRTILSTGSPLADFSYTYVYADVRADVCLSSISGGTDIVSCFALGNPIGPVYRGELQTLGLGMRVEVRDEAGRPTTDAGELVCTAPFPSMPVRFWDDPDGRRYHAAYFEYFPGVWRHGDWVRRTPHGGLVIYGRSDTTLNPGGVRIGTAEIYRVVEQFPEIVESVAVGEATPDGDVRTVLFVRLAAGIVLDDDLAGRLKAAIRHRASPHHVPQRIVAVADIPRTVSGKVAETAVRDALHGRPVANAGALANPDALALYRPTR